jgi:glycosyltransferase involved in cell wall biosynthesis
VQEGFGFTVLDAISRGWSGVFLRATAIPEVAGDAAVMGEPDKPGQFKDGMLEVSASASLRQRLRDHGIARAKQYTWEATARETLRVCGNVLGQGGLIPC